MLNRTFISLFIIIFALFMVTGCGVKSPPKPPIEKEDTKIK